MVHGRDDEEGGGLVGAGDGGLFGRGADDANEDEDGGSFLENVGEGVGGVAGALSGGGAAGFATLGFGAAPGAMAGKELGESVGGAVGGAVEDAGSAVGGWAKDNAGHLADASLTLATGGAYLWVDAATGGLSEVQKNAEEAKQAAEQRKKTFDEAGKNLERNGSVGTSDELLDDGEHGLEFFAEFLPIYRDWTGGGPDYEGEIVEEYDQLREIDFGAFREDAQRLEGVRGVVLDQTDTMNQAFQSAKRTWKGDAADAAGAKVGTFTGGGTTLVNETEALAGAIPPAIDGIQEAVREYSKFVLDLGKDLTCAGKGPQEAEDEVRKARGDLTVSDLGDAGIDDVFSGAWSVVKDAAIGFILGGPIGGMLGQVVGAADAAGEIRQGIIDDAKKWLDTAFRPEFDTKLGQFQQQSTSTQDTVQRVYDQLLEKTKLTDDPFAGLGEDGSGSGNQGSGEPGTTNQAQGSAPAATQTTSDPGATTGGGGGTSAGGGSPSASGDAPTGGGPSAADPSGAGPSGGGPSGEAGPGQPGGGDPKQPGRESDTVTLGVGKEEVTIAEPNDEGTAEVTMIGEDGRPKTYEVAFGPESTPPASPGDDSPGDAATGRAGQGAPSPEDGRPSAPGADAAPHQRSDSNERITPDEDGKAVIRDGDRTITLERGEEGDLRVSIDNGDQQGPTEQTIEFGADSSSGVGTGALPPESRFGSTPSESSPGPETGVGPEAGVGPGSEAGLSADEPAASNRESDRDTPQPPGGVPGAEGLAGGVAAPMGGEVLGNDTAAAPPPGPATAGVPSTEGSPAQPAPTGASQHGTGVDDAGVNAPASTTSQAASYTTIGRLGPDGTFTPWSNGPFASMSGDLGEDPDRTPRDRHDQFDHVRGDHARPTPRIASMQDADASSSQGATGIASMGDSGASGSGDQRSGGSSMMGMGGMGGMGAQQGGGDQERTSQWHAEGQLFDEVSRFSGLLGLSPDEHEDEAR